MLSVPSVAWPLLRLAGHPCFTLITANSHPLTVLLTQTSVALKATLSSSGSSSGRDPSLEAGVG